VSDPSPSLSVTFDNLGEAAQLERGMWPADVPIGQHFTVVEVLPRLLETLAHHALDASFFVEGLNAETYPDALQAIGAAGHEVAAHAWRHEQWHALEPDTERELLERTTTALCEIGLAPSGFRPPGGVLTSRTTRLLAELGYTHVSPAGTRAGVIDGLAVLPFPWPLVDAYGFMDDFASLRERYGDGPEPLTAEQMRDAMLAAVRRHGAQAGLAEHLTLIFHPVSFAFTGESGWEALDAVLSELAKLRTQGALDVTRMDVAADRLLAAAPALQSPPELDLVSWASSAS
jgi:peptidoglycan/xylan/chitin deacetylase (PgdA/CDA1 family)